MNYKNYNDYELIDKIQENDDDSKNIMFEKYNPILYRLAMDYYSKFSDYGYEYDDFVQEARISFYKALNSYNEKKGILFYSFVVMCVKRGLLSFCRRITGSMKNISTKYLVDLDDCNVEDEKSKISFLLDEHEFISLCRKVIYDLPFEIGIILELKMNGFNYREIGILLDLPSSSIEFRFRKAKRVLKLAINNY